MTDPVVIVGAGLAGLACGVRLQDTGVPVLVLEQSDGPGGRVRTDRIDGFLLDRGFQVLLAAYPEARETLDYAALDLHPFYPGALIRWGGRFVRVADPFRRPLDAARGLLGPPGTPGDRWRVLGLRHAAARGTLADLFARPETSVADALVARGFSPDFIDGFFRPFLGGVLLDRQLETSSRMMEFVMRMFAAGPTVVPAAGMEAIPRQLAARLPGRVRVGAEVTEVAADGVRLAGGERVAARCVVVATDGPAAARLIGGPAPASRSVSAVYFAAPRSPVGAPVLVLNGEGDGLVNNLAVLSDVAPTYAPAGRALVVASVIGDDDATDAPLEAAVRAQLTDWYGRDVKQWDHLRTYRIPHAQPAQPPGTLTPAERPVRLASGVYVCGDHRDHASIQGALASGRRAAEAVRAGLTPG